MGVGVPVKERVLTLDSMHSFLCWVSAAPGRPLGVSVWVVQWWVCAPTPVLLVSKHFHGENGHAGMLGANDLWLLRMF